MWKNHSLNTKIIGAFAVVSVLVGVTGWVATSGLNRVTQFVEHDLADQIHHGELVTEVDINLLKSQDATGEFLSTEVLADLPAIRRDFTEAVNAVDGPLSEFQSLDLTPVEVNVTGEIAGLKKSYVSSVQRMMLNHEKALQHRAEASQLLGEMDKATPNMLKALQYVGVSEAEQNIINHQVLSAFGYVATHNPAAKARYTELGEQIAGSVHYPEFAEFYLEFSQVATAAIGAVEQESLAKVAARDAMAQLDRSVVALQQRIGHLMETQAREIAATQEEVRQIDQTTVQLMIGLSIGSVLLSLLIGGLVARSIVGPMTRTIVALSDGSIQVEQNSSTISRASMQQAEGASEQAAAIQETTATMGEMSSRTEENARNAVTASGLAVETREAATEGNARMQEMAEAMRQIHDSSNEIAKVINVIDDIAFQTNILALNAAVEAARAGEAGMGFAVVADEVRNLAQRSAAAAKDTASMISESIGRSNRGVTIMEGAGSALDQITSRALEVSDLVDKIAGASQEQSSGIAQVTEAMVQMELVTQQAATSAEHSASSGEELNEQVNGLRDMVSVMENMVWGDGSPRPSSDDDDDMNGDGYAAGAADDTDAFDPNQQPWMVTKENNGGDMPILSPLKNDPKGHKDMELF